MKTKTVLVISHAADGSAKFLMHRLDEIGQAYQLVDLSHFPSKATGWMEFGRGQNIRLGYTHENGAFDDSSVKSIWWRQPKGKIAPQPSDNVSRYIALESEIFINGIFALLPEVLWVSNPEKTRIANSKPLQLQIAQQVGLTVPETLVSNDPNKVSDFLVKRRGIPLIMKPVGSSYVRVSDDPDDPEHRNLTIYTRILNKDEVLRNISRVRSCPVIFQEAMMQEFDVRVTVVGCKVFAVKITHGSNCSAGESNLDWRHHALDRIYEKHELPETVAVKCVELTKRLGLIFGALDFGYSKERGYTFFEINPQGQWVPSETEAGHPISLTLAKLLAQ